MYYDPYQNSEVSEGPNETRESRETSSEGKSLFVSLCAGTPPRPDGAAQRVMDGLLRECLRRKSLAP
jgi:hypothetical protein